MIKNIDGIEGLQPVAGCDVSVVSKYFSQAQGPNSGPEGRFLAYLIFTNCTELEYLYNCRKSTF